MKMLYHPRIPFLLVILFFLLFRLYAINGQNPAGEEKTPLPALLDHFTFDERIDDSAALAFKKEEENFLQEGDTLSAFLQYIRWMEYTILSNRIAESGTGFDPYYSYSNHRPRLKDHYLFQFFYGFNQSYRGSGYIAAQQFLRSENEIELHHPHLLPYLYFELSNKFIELNDFEGAIRYATKSLRRAQQTDDKIKELASRLLIATSFAKQNRIEEALRQRNQAIDLAHQTKEYGQLIFIYMNNAIDHRKLEQYDRSMEYYEKAYATLDSNTTFTDGNLRYIKSVVDLNKLTLWNDMELTDSVLNHYRPVIDSVQYYGLEVAIADGYVQTGRAYLSINDHAQALRYLQIADSISTEKKFDEKKLEAVHYLALLYKNTGRYEKATEALTTWAELKNQNDSIYNHQLVQTLQMRYESDRQLEIIEEKSKEVQEQKRIQKANARMFFASAGGLGLLSISYILWLNKRRLQREKDIEIQYSRKLIEFQESENERVSKELHDGVGQSLMMIKNKILLGNQEDSARMIGDTLEEIRSISRQLHPFTLQKLGLTAAIKKLLNEFDQTTEILIDYSLDSVDDHFSDKASLNIFRIVQESLNNVMKHSEAKALHFELKSEQKFCRIRIRDNGKGFDISENFNTADSLGLKTMKERTSLLKGQLIIDSSKGEGTSVNLKIPYDV